MTRLSLCTGLRRPKVFRDITYYINNVVDIKLSIDNFCAQTLLLCLKHRFDQYFPFLLYRFSVIQHYVYILSSRWTFQPVSRSKDCVSVFPAEEACNNWSQGAFRGVFWAQSPNMMNCMEVDIVYIDIHVHTLIFMIFMSIKSYTTSMQFSSLHSGTFLNRRFSRLE